MLEFVAEERREDLHLLIVGDGPYVPELRKLAVQLGIARQISLTGVVPREQVASHIAAFDVALQPAVVEYASPLKLFEYLTMCKAIVAPRMPNIEEVLDHGYNALLFAPGDTGEFKARLRQLVGNADLRLYPGCQRGQNDRRQAHQLGRQCGSSDQTVRFAARTARGFYGACREWCAELGTAEHWYASDTVILPVPLHERRHPLFDARLRSIADILDQLWSRRRRVSGTSPGCSGK